MGQCGTVNSYPVLVAQKEEERREFNCEFLLIRRSSPTVMNLMSHVGSGLRQVEVLPAICGVYASWFV